jgi:predicted RNase H-like HicB family nuclease
LSEHVVIYEQAEDGGWGAYLPDPGVVALGSTRERVADRIQEALVAYAEGMRLSGRPLLEPVHATGTARV